jgi:multiple antibiotic resistance protein
LHLIAFSLIGGLLLHALGISLPAFRVAGGLLLFVTGFRMIMGAHDAAQLNAEDSAYADRSHLAVFPLAIPFLAGPGCMTAVILSMSEAHAWSQKGAILAAIIVTELIALGCMLGAGRVVRMIGPGGSSLLARLMGILLAAMAVQFISDGLHGLFL